ncbi:MAG: transcription antitermination factor NusB [Clostridia bacterium]|nr:transcription antitermination factor NusB [Clostridia bacterium]
MATRREMREAVFALLFETGFHAEADPAEILAAAQREREIEEAPYIENTYLGAMRKKAALDVLIGRFSNGWKTTRMSHVSRAVLRLCAYEMLYSDVPMQVALNEAIELAKKYDDPKARPFVNGVLNSIKNEIETVGKEACALKYEEAAQGSEELAVEDDTADAAEEEQQ